MKPLKLLGSAIFILLVLFLITKFYLPNFLAYNKHVDSNNFLIESWISSYEIEQAVMDHGYDPDTRFYIVGYLYPKIEVEHALDDNPLEKVSSNGIWLYANSSLNFPITEDLDFVSGDTVEIIVTAKGQEAANRFAYFNVIINGKCIEGSFTQTAYKGYSFDWIVPEEGIQTCYIKFNNDLVANGADRNLNIKSVKIGKHFFSTNRGNCLVRDLNNLTSGFDSKAAEVMDYLQKLGIDQSQITAINFEPAPRNQTLAAAEKFNDYISAVSISDINVISSDIHSRRTWLTYQRIIGNQTNVGILYYHSMDYNKQNNNGKPLNLVSILHEYFTYLANWILLTF